MAAIAEFMGAWLSARVNWPRVLARVLHRVLEGDKKQARNSIERATGGPLFRVVVVCVGYAALAQRAERSVMPRLHGQLLTCSYIVACVLDGPALLLNFDVSAACLLLDS